MQVCDNITSRSLIFEDIILLGEITRIQVFIIIRRSNEGWHFATLWDNIKKIATSIH